GSGHEWKGVRHAAILSSLDEVVEECEEAVVVALRDRIEFVIMTARALERESQPRHSQGAHTIRYVRNAIFFFDNSALRVDHVVAAESRGDPLLYRGFRQQVAR